jgi:hypothetical protein
MNRIGKILLNVLVTALALTITLSLYFNHLAIFDVFDNLLYRILLISLAALSLIDAINGYNKVNLFVNIIALIISLTILLNYLFIDFNATNSITINLLLIISAVPVLFDIILLIASVHLNNKHVKIYEQQLIKLLADDEGITIDEATRLYSCNRKKFQLEYHNQIVK